MFFSRIYMVLLFLHLNIFSAIWYEELSNLIFFHMAIQLHIQYSCKEKAVNSVKDC